MKTPIQLIIGLGNPGPEYHRTRHNAGADFVLELAHQHNVTLKPESKFFGSTGRTRIGNRDVRLLLPNTYMNRSGQAVAPMARFYQIPPDAILVVHDELDLPPGIARFKLGGGPGGNNGLRSVIQSLGNCRDFARLRIGIGHPGNAKDVTNYVLGKASKSDQQQIDDSMDDALHILPVAVEGDWQQAMNELHKRS